MSTIPNPRFTFTGEMTSRIHPSNNGQSMGVFRSPSDPLFYTNLALENIVPGSRYRVTRASNSAELATGVAAGTSVVLSGIPAFDDPMLVNITVRNASGSPAYRIFDTAAFLGRSGASAYILQQLDE